MTIRSKPESYIGFALRAGKYRCGVNAISTLKDVKLLILCSTAAKNTRKEAEKLARQFHCKIVLSKAKTVEELTGKENCKLMAITDASLAKAIMDNLNGDFTQFEAEAE